MSKSIALLYLTVIIDFRIIMAMIVVMNVMSVIALLALMGAAYKCVMLYWI